MASDYKIKKISHNDRPCEVCVFEELDLNSEQCSYCRDNLEVDECFTLNKDADL